MNAVLENRGNQEGWKLVPLGDLGRWSGGGTPSKSKKQFWDGGTIPWVSPKDMKTLVIRDSEDYITEEAVLTSIAGRLARMEHRLSEDDDKKIRHASGGYGAKDLSRRILEALNPDNLNVAWVEQSETREPVPQAHELEALRIKLIRDAVKALHDPKLRELLVEVKKKNEITIDHVSQDEVIEAGFSLEATERARGVVQSFEQFIEDHKDEITALQILYSKPYKARLSFDDIKELADQIQAPPNLWTESQLWQAYAALEKTKVKGAGGRRILTDLVSFSSSSRTVNSEASECARYSNCVRAK